MEKETESEEDPETIRENRILFDDGNESPMAPEGNQLDVIEEIPLEEMAEEMRAMDEILNRIQGRLSHSSAGVLDESRNQEDDIGQRHHGILPVILKNGIGFNDADDSQTGAEEAKEKEREHQLEEIQFKEMAEETTGLNAMLDRMHARLSAGVLGKAPNQGDEIGLRHHGKPVILENCIGFHDADDSHTDAEETKEEDREHQLEGIPFKEMAEEIRVMNATLDRMQARLPVDAYEEIAKLTSNLEDEMGLEPEDTRWMILNGSKDPEIRALQVNSRRIRCQVADLVRCSELGATRLMAMTRQTIRHSKHLMAYRKHYESVHSFHLTNQLEAGKCLMRYRHSQQVYSSWRELYQMGRKAKEAYNKILEITQTRGPYLDMKKRAFADIAEAHSACISSSSSLTARVEELGQALGIPSSRTSKNEPQQWKDYTGPPVVVKTTHWQGQYTHTVRFARGELLTIPVVVPPIAATWYGRMQARLLRDQLPKTIQDSCTQKNVKNH